MKLKFTDGVSIETGGPLRKIHLEDGWYLVGAGFCFPVDSEEEANTTILEGMTKPTSPGDPRPVFEVASSRTQLVFVYGTLRKGQWNHHHIQHSSFLGMAKTKSKYALYASGIPYLSRSKAVSRVVGEVYAVDDVTLQRLDELEGHPNAYRREQAEVVLDGSKEELTAWIYFHDEPWGELVESGDFLKRNEPRRRRKSV